MGGGPLGWLMAWGAGTWREWTPLATPGVLHIHNLTSLLQSCPLSEMPVESLNQKLQSIHGGFR